MWVKAKLIKAGDSLDTSNGVREVVRVAPSLLWAGRVVITIKDITTEGETSLVIDSEQKLDRV